MPVIETSRTGLEPEHQKNLSEIISDAQENIFNLQAIKADYTYHKNATQHSLHPPRVYAERCLDTASRSGKLTGTQIAELMKRAEAIHDEEETLVSDNG